MEAVNLKTAIIIDHSNLWHTYLESQKLRKKGKLDYSKLVNKLAGGNELVGKVIFINKELAGRPLCQYFDMEGFETIEKQAKVISIKGSRVKCKCNLDVEIAIVAMQMVFDRELYPVRPEKIIIVTGDSDFAMLGQAIISYGIEVEFTFFLANFAVELKREFSCKVIDNLEVWKNKF